MRGTPRLFDFDKLHLHVPTALGWSMVPPPGQSAPEPPRLGRARDPYEVLADQAIAAGQVDPAGRSWAVRFFRVMGETSAKGVGPMFRRGCVTTWQGQWMGAHLEVYFEPPFEDLDVDGDPSRLEFLARKLAPEPEPKLTLVEHPLGRALRAEQRTRRDDGQFQARVGYWVPLPRVGDGRSVVLCATGSVFGGPVDPLVAAIHWTVTGITLTTDP